MTYLLSQIFISLLLAAMAGGALGWIAKGLKARRRERELGGLLDRHASALAQAQQERQMISDDYDEMQLSLESRVGELQVENRKIPEMQDNLAKSQQLVQQMMKSHESEIADLQLQSGHQKTELDNLRVQQKNDQFEISALRKTNSELGGSNIGGSNSADNNSQLESAADHPATEQPQVASGDLQAAGPISTEASSKTTQPAEQPRNSFARTDDRAHRTANQEPVNPQADQNTATHAAAAQLHESGDQTGTQARDDLDSIIGESADQAAVTQAELLELESEIEEMRGYNRDHSFTPSRDYIPQSATSPVTTTAGLTATTGLAATTTAVMGSQATTVTTASSQQDTVNDASLGLPPSSSANNDASAVAELRDHFSAGGDPEATDDLQTIHGIGPVMERSLNDIGITNYHQIAELTRREIEDIAEILEIFPGRIERDNWIGSARKLAEESSVETTDNSDNEAQKEAGSPALHAEEV